MKKTLTTAGVALALGLFAGVATTAHADDATDTAQDSNAQFSVQAADGGAVLKLNQVPGFDFGTVSQSDLISGDATKLSLDSTDTGTLNVTDYRGTNTGWNVNAKVTDFTNDKDTFGATSFTLHTGKTTLTADNFAGGVTDKADLVQGGDVLATTEDSTGTGSTTANFDAGSATLLLPKHTTAKPGSYSATINWTLGSDETVPAAGDTSNS